MSVINILSKNVRSSVFSLAWSAAMQIYWIKRRFLHEDKVQLPQKPFRSAPAWPLFRCNWRSWSHVKTPHKRSLIQVRARRVFPCNSINLRYDNRPYPYHLLSRQNQDMCDHEKWRKWRIFPLVRIMGKTVSFFDIECSVIDQFRYVKIHTALGSDAKGNWQTEEIILKITDVLYNSFVLFLQISYSSMTFNISKLGLVRKNQLINANIYVILKSIDHCALQADILFLYDQ